MTEFLTQNFLLVAVFAVSGGMLLFPLLRPGGSEVSPVDATLKINRENAVVIDVRTPAEFSSGHVPESINIPKDKLGERMADLEKYKSRPVIVNCASGVRSAGACRDLRQAGFEQVFSLAGGMNGWLQAGLPSAKGNK